MRKNIPHAVKNFVRQAWNNVVDFPGFLQYPKPTQFFIITRDPYPVKENFSLFWPDWGRGFS